MREVEVDHRRRKSVMLLCGCLALPAAIATATWPRTASAQASSTHAATQAASRIGGHEVCLDTVFYASMPGKTNYCLGLRDWKYGHYSSGLDLLKLAAGWGNKSAEYALGLIYYNGHHVQTNRALGMAWLQLADQRHDDPQIERVAHAAAKLATADERQQAQQLYRRMRQHYGDKVAAARAWHHLRHWERRRGRKSGVVYVSNRQAWLLQQAGLCRGSSTGRELGAQLALNAALQATMRLAQGAAHKKPPGIQPGPALTFNEAPPLIMSTCNAISFTQQNHLVRRAAKTYFRGWIGHVTVEPLQQAPAPATSSGQ